jgi:hypothetical protein
MGYGFTVFSKLPSSKEWKVERTYGLKSYADEVAAYIKKQGKRVRVRVN